MKVHIKNLRPQSQCIMGWQSRLESPSLFMTLRKWIHQEGNQSKQENGNVQMFGFYVLRIFPPGCKPFEYKYNVNEEEHEITVSNIKAT